MTNPLSLLRASVSPWWIFLSLALTSNAQQIHFRDVTSQAGIHFTHNNGAFGKKWLPETMGPGCAFIDYDNDGYPDILLVNGTDWPSHHHAGATSPKLYHNNHDGTFTDVTHKAGLDVPMFGLGVAVGDYDNDGFDDLFITALGQSHLFHNNGNGTFTEVTKAAGMSGPSEFSTSAAWVDYDRDGKLDLVVANYVRWSEETDLYCTLDGAHKSYCTPESYKGTSVRLWHNLGGGKFEDATQKAGLGDPTSKSLGITILDYNADGWPDILIANDTQPNKLYLNKKDGTFEERGVPSGIAFSEDGIARAGMGVDAADYDRSGHPSVIITNFANQMVSLYHNEGNGLFVDEAPQSEVGRATLVTLGFGCFFFDYDNDGWPDIFVADGHIEDADRACAKARELRRAVALVSQSGRRQVPGSNVADGPGLRRAQSGAGHGLRRYRQRRLSRCSSHYKCRPSFLVPQRGRIESQPAPEAGGHKVKPRRYRRGCAGHIGSRQAIEDAPLRLELSFAERTGAHVWSGLANEG